MATKKPRITITLNPNTYGVLKVISDCGDKTMSGFVSEMLDAAIPTLERMAATFQAIKNAQDAERQKFLSSIDRAQAALEPAVIQAVGQFDLFLGRIEEAAAAVETDGARATPASPPLAASNPRPVTRGSTPLNPKPHAAPKTTRKASSKAGSGRKS